MRILRFQLYVLFASLFCATAHAGYTHYFTWHQKPNDTDLKACINEMRRIIETRTNMLAGPDGTAASIIGPTGVDLNGIGDDAHEPFVFPGEEGFNFCKTQVKPYDAVVTACLLVARDHFPQSVLSIDSDGSWSEGDWEDGAKLYSSVLGRTPRNPISPAWRMYGWRVALFIYGVTASLLIIMALVIKKLFRRFKANF
jgi:hypothetical protein